MEYFTLRQNRGGSLADLMMRSLLARELPDEEPRRDFQKAVAMVNEPGACYEYTSAFLRGLLLDAQEPSPKDQLLKLRQAYICINAITTWAVEANNLESIYRVSELGMLLCWHVVRKNLPEGKKPTKFQLSLHGLMDQFVKLHLTCSELYLAKTAFAHGNKRHALSVAVRSREAVDVNLAMFELLGRVAIRGIWTATLALNRAESDREFAQAMAESTHLRQSR